ncbi:MAG: glycoside hydrolase family 32 protein [Tannerellaceae bacterium]|nr:glycoside hydrolase family 32 protein [Tannerellaceae bacterium]
MLETHQEYLNIYVDGHETYLTSPVINNVSTISEVIVAKDYRNKSVGIFGTTAINGIIDEFQIHTEKLNMEEQKPHIAALGQKKAVLAIPPERFANDFSRPKYHLLPAANWTNETHGLFYHNGEYHIFNQKNASNLFLGQINWGHFSSPDLISWTEQKPAITPEPGYDMNGIWSGHAVINNEGVPTLIYTTGGEKMGVGLAFPVNDELIEWQKYEANPVICGQPEGYTRTDLRDQYVWKEGNTWYMIIGFGITDEEVERGAVLLYKSADLKKWDFVHTMFEGNPAVDNSGKFWEMPVFFQTQGKYVLLVNRTPQRGMPARALYWTGNFTDKRFIPDNPIPRNLEVVNRLLSPSLTHDKDGRITTIAIIPDEIGSRAAYQHGWTHLYSIPRVWSLQQGKIAQIPHPVLEQLRGERRAIKATVKENSPILISQGTHQLEIKVKIDPAQSERYGFILHKNPDNSEFSQIYYDVTTNEIVVDQRKSSLKKNIPLQIRKDTYPLDSDKPEDFHMFIDGSVVEVFINGKEAFTTRIFPLRKNSNQVEIFTLGGSIHVKGEQWKINSAQIQTNF